MPDIQSKNPINDAHNVPSQHHSNFNLSRYRGLTPRFGVNTPIMSIEVVPDDGPITIEPNSVTRTYTLKAPLFGEVKKHVSFYQVPLQAILPNNWSKVVKQSDRGTDVQNNITGEGVVSALNGVNCVVSDFAKRICDAFITDFAVFQERIAEPASSSAYISDVLHFIVRWEMFFSHGSLLSYLGVHYGQLLKFTSSVDNSVITFDGLCQYMLYTLIDYNFSIVDNDGNASISGKGAQFVRRVLDFMRSHSGKFLISCADIYEEVSYSSISVTSLCGDVTEPLNFGRLVAYQIVNAHYLTNSKIDYVYSADLYRQYISSLVKKLSDLGSSTVRVSSFKYNGIDCYYDFLSGFYMNGFITRIGNFSFASTDYWTYDYPYLNAIFGFNYSLRFMDYFVGARPRNYAIGDTSVRVVDGSVSVLDTTKNIVKQRYLNAVARAKQNIEDYSKEILGTSLAYDWHDPKYLFSYDENLHTSEIENTGSNQFSEPNSISSIMRGQSFGKQFTFSIDRHSFIVGIENFDFRRFYFTTQERNTMAIDRFDMFVSQLQYIGDQELRRSELIAGTTKDMPFGYQLRDMQFKQSFDDCVGGFVENLPGWLMTFDPTELSTRVREEITISPAFIRSEPTEIDRFYLSMTGLTLASYFHFIELWDIKISANRPMAYAPQIL